tara:strand:- start:137 stop:691 length:555 start_codon:yes stop_codon:yes gene_type:complete
MQFSQMGISHLDTLFVASIFGFSQAAAYRILILLSTLLSNNESVLSHVFNSKIKSSFEAGTLKDMLWASRKLVMVLLFFQFVLFVIFGKQFIAYILDFDIVFFELCLSVFILHFFKDIFSLSKTTAIMLQKDKEIFHAAMTRIACHAFGLSVIYTFQLNLQFLIINYYLSNVIELMLLQRNLSR